MNLRSTVPPFILALTAAAAYANSFAGVFLFDDIIRIVEEPRIQRLWPVGPLLTGERPVVDLTLAINHAVSGLQTWSYHAFNLVIHILAGVTLYGVAWRTILRAGTKAPSPEGADLSRPGGEQTSTPEGSAAPARFLAFGIALLFLVHPLQTQSVTYIIQRGESMMGLFYLLTLYCAIRAVDSSRAAWWCVAAIVACALGMGTKAVMVTAPVMVVLWDWVFLGNQRTPFELRRRRLLYAGLLATWTVLWICGIGPEVLNPNASASHVGFSYRGHSAWEYAATQPGVIVQYLQLAFWPASLCLDYDWPIAHSWPQIVVPSLFVGVLAAASGYLLYRRHWLGFVGAWFFVILSPTSSIVPIKDVMFEHRMYLPLAAVIAAVVTPLAAGVLKKNANGPANDQRRALRYLGAALLVGVAAPLAYATHVRNRVYHSELAMWQDVVRKRPDNARAHIALANALAAENRIEEAIEAARRSILVDPGYADGHFGLGNILSKIGRTEEAISSYQRVVHHNPGHSRAWYNMANAMERIGQSQSAIEAYESSIEANPHFADAWVNYGNALVRQGRIDEGIAKFQRALTIQPEHAKAHNNLGDAFTQLGRLDQAQREFEAAIRIEPGYSKARFNLALLLRRRGLPEQAAEQLHALLAADPSNAAAQSLLSELEPDPK